MPGIERRFSCQQLVKQHAQRINVAARVDVQTAHLRLLRTHVGGRADKLVESREDGLVREPLVGRGLGDAEVDHLGHGHTLVQCDQDVRWFDVAVNDSLLVRMLDGLANLDEQVETFAGAEIVLIAVIGDFDPAHQFHHEVGPARLRSSSIEDLGDVRMVHQRQRLPLCFKAGNDASGVHAQLDDLQGDAAANRFLLLRHIHDAAATLADFLEQFVTPDLVAGFFGDRDRGCGGCQGLGDRSRSWVLKKLAGLLVRGQERLHLFPEHEVAGTLTIQ